MSVSSAGPDINLGPMSIKTSTGQVFFLQLSGRVRRTNTWLTEMSATVGWRGVGEREDTRSSKENWAEETEDTTGETERN